MKINSRTLVKPLGNQTSLIFVNGSIRYVFSMKNPFATSHILCGISRNQFPSPIANKGIILIIHNLTPLRIFELLGYSGGSRLSLVLSWIMRLCFWISLWILCLDLVTMTRGEDGDSQIGLLMVGMVGGWWWEGWNWAKVVVWSRLLGKAVGWHRNLGCLRLRHWLADLKSMPPCCVLGAVTLGLGCGICGVLEEVDCKGHRVGCRGWCVDYRECRGTLERWCYRRGTI